MTTKACVRRVVVIGAGAVGAGIAAELALRSIPHLLVGRGEQIHHIHTEGLRYVRPDGVRRVQVDTSIGIEATALRDGDLLVIATKTQDVESVARSLAWKPVEGREDATELPVLTLQNGLASERILLRWFSEVYAGSLRIPAHYTKVGEVASGASPKIAYLVLGRTPGGVNPFIKEIAELFRELDFLVQLEDDVLRWKAQKLVRSVTNSLDIFSGSEEEKNTVAEVLTQETHEALLAAGFDVAAPSEWTEDWSLYQRNPNSGIPQQQRSTWQSFARGTASTEIDYLNGEVVLLGRLHGVPTPGNAAVQKILGRASLQHVQPGAISLTELFNRLPRIPFRT